DYLSNVNWKRDNWSYSQLEEGMRKFLGERPSMEVDYKKDVMVNEISGESREIKRIDSISVVFTDTDDKIKKIKITID
ncbi:hypothetical protein EBU94_07230, partial [bacterium]|nr:hypothetical protein [bacterium]